MRTRTLAFPSAARPVPGVEAGPIVEDRRPVLLWVHTGSADVRTPGVVHRLVAGEALWVPPGVEHCIRIDPGSVVFPLFPRPPELDGALTEVHLVAIPSGWEAWLIHQWDDNAHTSQTVPGAEALIELVESPPLTGASTHSRVKSVSLPQSREALDVARMLLRDPSSPRELGWFAAAQHVSPRTLQRQFRRETGLSFAEWRTRARIAKAASLIDRGCEIGWSRVRVGFATPAGFTRAFQRHTGLTPRAYARRRGPTATLPQANAPSVTIVPVAVDGDPIGVLLASAPPRPPRIPKRAFWTLVNDDHLLMWVYRGRVRLSIGRRQHQLSERQAIWVPAGLAHTIEFDADSLMLTIARHHGKAMIAVEDLIAFTFPAEAETFLLHTLVAEFTLLRPAHGQGELGAELFRIQITGSNDSDEDTAGALARITSSLRRQPADSRSLADWAHEIGLPSVELGQQFLAQTGLTFPRWRAHLRMDIARTLLTAGDSPGTVARRLGYANPAVFSKVFAAAHGIAPREYQQRESQRT